MHYRLVRSRFCELSEWLLKFHPRIGITPRPDSSGRTAQGEKFDLVVQKATELGGNARSSRHDSTR